MIIFSEKKCKIALAGIMLAASLVLLCTRSVYANDNSGKIKKDTTKSIVSIPSNIPSSAKQTYAKGTYHVSKDGTKDFTSIATAVVLVPSGSTLIIHEGVYNEALNIQNFLVNMKGVS